MHFDFDFVGNEKNNFLFHGHGNFSFDNNEIILDPSVLCYLAIKKINKTDISFYIPDNFLRLIKLSKENNDNREFLKSFLTFFRYDLRRKIEEKDMALFYSNIEHMNIKPITIENIQTDQKANNYEIYLKMFSNPKFNISMSPIINFLGDYIAKILEFSRKTGKIILSKTRKLADLLQEKVFSLELPKDFFKKINNTLKESDNMIKFKSEILNKIFDFNGGKTAKFFIAICLFIHPEIIAGLGLAFIFIDP